MTSRPEARVRILSYHAITDLPRDHAAYRYGISPAVFTQHLEQLSAAGFNFIDADQLFSLLAGRATVPRRPVLITFDDCHESVEQAAEIMERRGVPGVAFAVSRALEPDVPDLCATGALLDRAGLRRLVRHGLEIGAHSHTHRPLVDVDETDLWTETDGSIRRLTAAGVGTVRLFAYPYGAHDARVRQCVARAGARAAFTVDPGFAVTGSSPLALPRIEIYRGDTGLSLRIKVETGGAMLRVRACLRLRSRAGTLARRFRAVEMPHEASPHDPVRS